MKTYSPGIYILYSRFYVAALVDSHVILVRHDCMVGILCSASRKYWNMQEKESGSGGLS